MICDSRLFGVIDTYLVVPRANQDHRIILAARSTPQEIRLTSRTPRYKPFTMFYYISFLRPPPVQASTTPSEHILIMPQISNDLRTEYLEDPIDIYYAWSLHAPHPTSPLITKPAKLTSWRTSTAYKEIPVPRPPHLDGQNRWSDSEGPSWRLILSCGTTQNNQVVVLGENLNTPFAVMSMPVNFPRRHGRGNKNTLKGTKQERIARSYTLRPPLQDRPIVFDIMEQTSFDLDKVRPPPYITVIWRHILTPLTGQP